MTTHLTVQQPSVFDLVRAPPDFSPGVLGGALLSRCVHDSFSSPDPSLSDFDGAARTLSVAICDDCQPVLCTDFELSGNN